ISVMHFFNGFSAFFLGELLEAPVIKKSREICSELGDYVSKELFDELLKDEEGHVDFLETQIDLLNSIGVERYGMLNAASADEAG
ncbi:MAG: ferritin-like domain-containing protein, partial [Rickettsia endosymbiont of Ixodes persulcatus]|nr:ferritin-like domain-containing protein [Rickettsia endosymbiont of Ixodes persulcatus]